jgi:hypothetical protein
MDILVEKQKLKKLIDSIHDESLILSIKKFLGLIKERQNIPLTKEELIERALESEKAIAKEKFISIEDLEKEMKNW